MSSALRSRKPTTSPSAPKHGSPKYGSTKQSAGIRDASARLSLSPILSLPPLISSPSFLTSTSLFCAFNFLGFLISIVTGSHLHLDLIGTGAFLPATLLPVLSLPFRTLPLSLLSSQLTISLWSTRLASFLFYRATILRHDARLTETLSSVSGTAGFWFVSAIWGIFCSLPHALAYSPVAKAAKARKVMAVSAPYAIISTFGFALSLLGLAVEVTADFQKWDFKSTHAASEFINTGLWRYTQHPNYVGNIIIFVGLYLQNVPTLTTSLPRLAAALLGPVFITTLLYLQAAGLMGGAFEVAAIKAMEKYGETYKVYMDTTPVLWPTLPWK